MSTPAIQVDGAWKTFRIFSERHTTLKQAVLSRRRPATEEFWALRDVSFDVPAGSTFGIVGGNGAGKSTLLKLLSRILVPDKGRVAVDGHVSALLELGAGFHPELTGRENVFLNGAILGMSKAKLTQRFDDIVEFAGLDQFIDNPVKTYSSGMYARLGFSIAVNVEPDILLLDEVLAVGDEQFQRRCAERMAELRSGGRTVVFVSHALGQVQQMCDHAVWLDHGRVASIGATTDVVDSYLASVTLEYRVDARGRQRSGTGEVALDGVLLPTAGHDLVTGDSAVVRLQWEAVDPVDDVMFAFSVRNVDGTVVAGSVTAFELPIERLHGRGAYEYSIPSLSLLPGSYQLSAAVMDRQSQHVYDHSPEMARFDVHPSDRYHGDAGGLVTFGGGWRSVPGASS